MSKIHPDDPNEKSKEHDATVFFPIPDGTAKIYKVLGIEAVRKSLVQELRNVLKPYGIYVNYRHISILCDLMTQKGNLTSITRHGLNRAEYGPIRKADRDRKSVV